MTYKEMQKTLSEWGDLRGCIEDCKHLQQSIGENPSCEFVECVPRFGRYNCEYYELDEAALEEKKRVIEILHTKGVLE